MTADQTELRFEFGENWKRFLNVLSEERIREAESDLVKMLGTKDLCGKLFLDVGSGSGLSSLAARRLGASVYSFDYDRQSVACTEELKRRYFPGDSQWRIEQGSVLDETYLSRLGKFDIVYSWGVLHHTGAMWRALGNVDQVVAQSGVLFIAIYNDQGRTSDFWRAVKRAYNMLPAPLRLLVLVPSFARLWGPTLSRDLVSGHPQRSWCAYKSARGMSPWRDLVDWVGGYPFEVARPEQVFDFVKQRGYELIKLSTCGGGHGCNEYVFMRQQGKRMATVELKARGSSVTEQEV